MQIANRLGNCRTSFRGRRRTDYRMPCQEFNLQCVLLAYPGTAALIDHCKNCCFFYFDGLLDGFKICNKFHRREECEKHIFFSFVEERRSTYLEFIVSMPEYGYPVATASRRHNCYCPSRHSFPSVLGSD